MEIVMTEMAPKAIGPYSQAIKTGNLIITSGQLPINPGTGEFAECGIQGQTEQCLMNIRRILEEAGTTMNRIVKTTVFLKNMDDFASMNQVYNRFFQEGKFPSRSAVEVARLPKDALIEIEAIAEL